MSVQVKICGLTRAEDVRCVAECEAEFAGFILYEKSRRYVSPRQIRELTRLLPASTTKVGVVVNASPAFAIEACAVGGLDLIQFCGDEPVETVAAMPRAWRASRSARCCTVRTRVSKESSRLRKSSWATC